MLQLTLPPPKKAKESLEMLPSLIKSFKSNYRGSQKLAAVLTYSPYKINHEMKKGNFENTKAISCSPCS